MPPPLKLLPLAFQERGLRGEVPDLTRVAQTLTRDNFSTESKRPVSPSLELSLPAWLARLTEPLAALSPLPAPSALL